MTQQQETEKQYLIEQLILEISMMLIADYKIPMQQALDLIYQSKTFAKIEDPNTGLYYQGAVYVYQFLKEEINN